MPRELAGSSGTAALSGLSTSNLGDGGDDFSGHPHFSAVVVSSHMVGGQSEELCQRVGAATSAGSEEL